MLCQSRVQVMIIPRPKNTIDLPYIKKEKPKKSFLSNSFKIKKVKSKIFLSPLPQVRNRNSQLNEKTFATENFSKCSRNLKKTQTKTFDDTVESISYSNHLQLLKIHRKISELISLYKIDQDNTKEIMRNLIKHLKDYFNLLKVIGNNLEIFFKKEKKYLTLFHKILIFHSIFCTVVFLILNFYSVDEFRMNAVSEFLSIFSDFSVSFLSFYSNYFLNSQIRVGDKSLEIVQKHYIKTFLKSSKIKNEHFFLSLIKNLERCNQDLKCYTALTMKFSKIKIYTEIIEEILPCQNFNYVSTLLTKNVLFGLLSPKVRLGSTKNFNSIQVPFLAKINSKYQLSLVVDLDETLIHSFSITDTLHSYYIRPFCFEFLEELSSLFEIIVFTAGTKEYADNILNAIDPRDEFIQHRLYRDHMSFGNNSMWKDLSLLGRNLNKTIIIDNLEDNFAYQKDNGLVIKTWNGNFSDKELFDLKSVLKSIAIRCETRDEDIRDIVKKVNKAILHLRERPYKNINIDKL